MATETRGLLLFPRGGTQDRVRDTVTRVLRERGVTPIDLADAIPVGARWTDEVKEAVHSSHFVVADLTRQSPNIFIEIGMAHAVGKPLLMLISSDAETGIPSDLAGYQFLTYDPGDLSSLKVRLEKAVRAFTTRREV